MLEDDSTFNESTNVDGVFEVVGTAFADPPTAMLIVAKAPKVTVGPVL